MTNTTNPNTTTETKHNPFEAFDPMAMWTRSQELFRDLMTDALARSQAFADHVATLEADAMARASSAVAAWAQLAQDSISYGAQLSAEARKLGVETAKKLGVSA
jgi:hypothetical protein